MASHARLESRGRDFHGSLRELPDRENDTQNEDCVNQNLQDATAFFFGAYYESVSGFELVVHNIGFVDSSTLRMPHAIKWAYVPKALIVSLLRFNSGERRAIPLCRIWELALSLLGRLVVTQETFGSFRKILPQTDS